MDTDCYGIAHEYEDAFGVLRITSRKTRDAIRQAMGVDEEGAEPSVRVIDRRHKAALEVGPGELQLEDGSSLSIVDRLPSDIPLGYHDFLPRGRNVPVRLIISPGRCFPPPGKPAWGWAVQLYAARSAESWGLGDLADLRTIAEWSRPLGAGFLVVNPLSAVDPMDQQENSPYFPSSRRFRNPLYLRVEEVPGASALGDELVALQVAGRQLNGAPLIVRDEVYRLKQQALRGLWERFTGDAEFDRYCLDIGPSLRQFGTYCVLVERFGPDWSKWPAEYRRPDAPGITRFAAENSRRIGYHEWLQWHVDRQLATASARTSIVQDMPIGISPRGADAWAWQHVLAEGTTVGAPPDLYNTQGQNWGMPPLAPQRLKAARYAPFIETIRALLRHAGGLRIDHVLGLFRLFWIPHGMSAVDGTYVQYPVDDLLNIVALESHRAGAFIVGEDLGTVGKNVRQKLADACILSNRLLWFEQGPTTDFPKLALAAVTTHDLPTIAGLWSGSDLAAQQSIGQRPDVAATTAIRDRLQALIGLDEQAPIEEVVRATHEVLARAPSALVTATLEDAAAVDRRPNMPATTTQWPNWCIPLPVPLESLFDSPLAQSISRSLSGRGSKLTRRSVAKSSPPNVIRQRGDRQSSNEDR